MGNQTEPERGGMRPNRAGFQSGDCENRTSNPGHTRFHSVPLQSGRARSGSFWGKTNEPSMGDGPLVSTHGKLKRRNPFEPIVTTNPTQHAVY